VSPPRLLPQQGDVANTAVSRWLERLVAEETTNVGADVGPRAPQTLPATGADERSFDLLALVREQQDVVADLLEEQLERALDLLIDCRLASGAGTLADKRRVLFDLYDAGVVTKSQVRERGGLEPGEFHVELRAHRTRSR
jgi:hypothetical protein